MTTPLAPPQPGDFAALPMAPPGGLAIEGAQWLEQLVETHKLLLPQHYEHAEIYVGMPDAAGPYGYSYSTYPNRMGKRALPIPPAEMPGALWSSGLVNLTVPQRRYIVAWCEARPAVPYSSLDYAALIGHTLGLDTAWLQRYISDQAHMICSQYVDSAYNAAGVQLFTDERWAGYVTPLDLALLLETMGAVPQPG